MRSVIPRPILPAPVTKTDGISTSSLGNDVDGLGTESGRTSALSIINYDRYGNVRYDRRYEMSTDRRRHL